ncbi:MAG TPA: NADH:flavin oxidoreductase/NADH oxidase [Gammaproteobacteria bacterium]
MNKKSPPSLFAPIRIRDLELANRIVMSPMCQYSCEDGMPTDWHLVHLGSRAIGGAGLVWAEMTAVSREGRVSPGCAGLYLDEHVAPWRRVTDFVHAQTSARIGIQLGHAGRKAATKRMWEGHNVPLDSGAWPLLGPSPDPFSPDHQVPREMDRADMDRIVGEYVRAARRALDAGFDAVELHAAHGYLPSSFLSPISNLRTDDYGGQLSNRLRFPLEIVDALRAALPDEVPLSAKISSADLVDGGNTIEEGVQIAKALAGHGVDIVSVSAGGITGRVRPPRLAPCGFVPFSHRIRESVDAVVAVVGNINTPAEAAAVVSEGSADLVVMARAFLRDPYWPLHAAIRLGVDVDGWPDQYCAVPLQLEELKARLGLDASASPAAAR